MIREALRSFLCGETDFRERLIEKNEFDIRTAEGRGRFYRGIKSSILKFSNEDHKDLYFSFFYTLDDNYPYNYLIFLLLAQNNLLFRKLSQEVYLKFYFNGKISITGEDIFAYLQYLQEADKVFGELNWTRKTMEPIASKYLTILRKLDLLEGRQKKMIKHIQVTDAELAIFVYVLKACYPETSNILTSDFLPFSFLTTERFIERVKMIAQNGWFEMSYSGTILNLEPILNYNQLSNGIFGRPQSKI
jgi:hypothetical protein